MKTDKTGNSYIRPVILGAAIFAVVFSHFGVSQFIAFQSEKNAVITEAIYKPPVEIKTEFQTEKRDVVKVSREDAPVSPVSKTETDRISPKQAVVKKKEASQESRAERLRRAERLLTGI